MWTCLCAMMKMICGILGYDTWLKMTYVVVGSRVFQIQNYMLSCSDWLLRIHVYFNWWFNILFDEHVSLSPQCAWPSGWGLTPRSGVQSPSPSLWFLFLSLLLFFSYFLIFTYFLSFSFYLTHLSFYFLSKYFINIPWLFFFTFLFYFTLWLFYFDY